MNENIKALIIAVSLLLGLTAAWFFLFYRPEMSKLDSIKNESGTVLTKIKSIRVTDAQVEALEKHARDLQQQIDEARAKIISKDALQTAVFKIQNHGRKFGLKFQKIIPDYDSLIAVDNDNGSNSEVFQLTLHMQIQGGYKNLGHFLESIDKLPFLISLGDISIAYNESFFPNLEIQLDAILYVYESQNSKA